MLRRTNDGEAFGGLFGGYECTWCWDKPEPLRCNLLFKSNADGAAAGSFCGLPGTRGFEIRGGVEERRCAPRTALVSNSELDIAHPPRQPTCAAPRTVN